MESKLAQGTSLIVDRYAFSGVAFSSAKVAGFKRHPLSYTHPFG